MPITDYAELMVATGEYCQRADLSDAMPRCVAFAESKLNSVLRFRQMEKTITPTPDVAGLVPLPSDYLQVKNVYVSGAPPIILRAMGADNAAREYMAGEPVGYIVSGLALQVVPASQRPLSITYYGALPALSNSTPSNWLLTRHPDIYLYAAAMEAGLYVADEALVARAQALLSQAIDVARRADVMSQVSNSALRFSRRMP